MHLQTPQEDSEAEDVCNLISYLHQPSQAEHRAQHTQPGAGPLKPTQMVFPMAKQHNEIRQEDGEDPTALCLLHITRAKCGWEVGHALNPGDKIILFFCRTPV